MDPDDGDLDALAPTTPTSSESMPSKEPPFRPSDRIGKRYQLAGLLGRGGMGAVYRARDEALGGQEVALKLVGGDLIANPAELKRLRDEVLLAQKVTHPAVCRTYDLEEIDGLWLIKMELVEGESLAHRLRRDPLAIPEVVRIARQIVRGLAAAHREGVIHRDLKPQNVMIERTTGRIVLMDFGVARQASRQSMTDIVGTPDYMAPEQARGDAIDVRADLYSLGCVMYEMLTGVVPYPPRTSTMIRMSAPDPRARRADTPRWLAVIVRRLLAREPAERPKDAAEVAALLDRRAQRRIAIAAGIAGAAIVLAGGAWVVASARHHAPWQPVLVEVLPRVDENFATMSLSPDGTTIAFTSDRDQRNGIFRLYVGALGSTEARVISPPGTPIESTEWADATRIYASDDLTGAGVLMPVDGSAPARVVERGVPAPCGPDAMMVRTYELDGAARFTLHAKAQPPRVVVEIKRPRQLVGTWHCSRDGARLVYAVATNDNILAPKSDLWEVVVAGGEPRQLTHDGLRNLNPSFTPDGSLVFSSARGGTMNVWERRTNGEFARLTTDPGDDLEPIATPDGKQLVYALDSTTSVIRSYGEAGGRRLSNARDLYASLAATPDGRELLAVTPSSESINTFDLGDGARRVLHQEKGLQLATLSADGSLLVYSVGTHPSKVFAVPRAGGTPRSLAVLDGELRVLVAGSDGAVHAELDAPDRQEAWSIPLDGAAVREADDAALVLPGAAGWKLVIGVGPAMHPRKARIVPPGATADDPRTRAVMVSAAPVWSHDGNVLVYYDGASVRRFDVRTGTDRVVMTPSDTRPWVAVSPDGTTVYVAALEGFVRRYLMTNFADRPR